MSGTAFSIKAHLPALVVVVPLLGSVLCALLRQRRIAWLLTLAVTWCTAIISTFLLIQVLDTGTISYGLGGWRPPIGIEYRVDILSAFMLLLVAWSGALIMVYAYNSVEQEIAPEQQPWFYTMYLLCMAGLLGITITGDAFNAFVFLEISSLSMYTLIALGTHRRALLSAYQYLIMGTIGATFYVLGIGLLYVMTGTLNFADLATRMGDIGSARPAIAALAFLTVGISLKLALFPLHAWLPNAYAYAPSVATAFIAGTATKVAIYLLMRIFFSIYGVSTIFKTLPINEILIILSLAAMFGASLVAIYQDNLKKLLAYSSVAQVGYITLGIALANKAGITGALVHIFNHAVMKTALFLAVGAIILRTNRFVLRDMEGIGRYMPITMAAFVIAGLGLIGTPGTAGFISKFYLASAALDKGAWWLVFAIVISSAMAVIYVGKVLEIVWFREPCAACAGAHDPPWPMLVPIVVLALAVIWFGFDTRLSAGIAAQAAEFLLGGAK